MTVTITKAPEHWPLPGTRCIFRGRLMDYETAAFLMAMEAQLGYTLTVVQGCYSTAVSASAGTHSGGGAFDLAPWDHDNKVRVARELGGASWHRAYLPGVWEEHIHTIVRKHPTLSGAAAQQVTYFDQKPRKNGLAGEPVDPDQYPGRPTPTFRYPPKAPPTPTFRAIGLNDDWENVKSDVAGLVTDFRPLVMGVQEGFRLRYRTVVPKRWGVKQVHDNDAEAGVAVLWDKRRLQALGRARRTPDPRKWGTGWQAIGKGADTRVRGVVWRDLTWRSGVDFGALPVRFRLASTHRPPMRDRSDWDAFDAVLLTWMKRSPLPVLLFMDSNEHGGPTHLVDGLHSTYEWHGVGNGIDGAVTSLPVRGTKDLPERTSDHKPVLVTLG